jgi:hypothetical protein
MFNTKLLEPDIDLLQELSEWDYAHVPIGIGTSDTYVHVLESGRSFLGCATFVLNNYAFIYYLWRSVD